MAEIKVTCSGKDADGDIIMLCNPSEGWARSKAQAIHDIESNMNDYYVQVDGKRVDIHVVKGPTGKYLRTDPDVTSKNNLDGLPGC